MDCDVGHGDGDGHDDVDGVIHDDDGHGDGDGHGNDGHDFATSFHCQSTHQVFTVSCKWPRCAAATTSWCKKHAQRLPLVGTTQADDAPVRGRVMQQVVDAQS